MLVVGGGVVGAGIAVDAATRGLSVGLVERADWAAGTSSRSSKLIHGGLRYLEMREFHLVSEALTERSRLLSTIAPHLVHPIEFCYPLTGRWWERPYTAFGLGVYDALSGVRRRGRLPRHRHLNALEVQRSIPALRATAHHGAQTYFDAGVDDARLVIALVRTAAAHGAGCVNHAEVQRLQYSPDGHATGAVLVDSLTGQEVAVTADRIVLATGVDTGTLSDASGAEDGVCVTASKGVHLLVPRDAIDSRLAMTLRTETSVLFVIPWKQHWIIGTTDTPWREPDGTPVVATADDVTYLLEHVNRVLERPLSASDVVAAYAGLRPLVTPASFAGQTVRISREHAVRVDRHGVVHVAGGKYTTYRVMAQDAVDAALRTVPARTARPCRTAALPLIGAHALATVRHDLTTLARDASVPPEAVERLIDRHGDQAPVVLAMADRDARLLEPLPGACDYLCAEVAYAVQCEGALELDDVLVRRLRVSIETADHGATAAATVADIVGAALGWDAQQRHEAVHRYLQRIAREEQGILDAAVRRTGS